MIKTFEPKDFIQNYIRVRNAVRNYFNDNPQYRHVANYQAFYTFISSSYLTFSGNSETMRELFARNAACEIIVDSDAITFFEVYYRQYNPEGLVKLTAMDRLTNLDPLEMAALRRVIINKLEEPQHKIEEVTMQPALQQSKKTVAFFPM